ncbi:MAG: DUF1059 domain-containing protein [Iamia sp.]
MTLEFRCEDVGVACRATTTAATEEELLEKVRAHASSKHGVELNATLADYAVSTVRQT